MSLAVKVNVATFDRCVLPVFVADGDRPGRLGSCVLVQLFGVHFAVTAAHVLVSANGRPIFVGAGKKLVDLSEGAGFFPNEQGTRHLDIAIVPLGTETLRKLDGLIFVHETSVETAVPQDQPSPTTDFIVFGYPESNSQFRVQRPGRNIRQNSFTFVTAVTRRDVATRENLDPEAHLILELDRENITLRGKRYNPPDPYGISWRSRVPQGR